MPVSTGIGRTRIARSVIIFTGAEHRYIVTMDIHCPVLVEENAALTGLHWKAFRNVRIKPETLTIARVM